MISIAGCDPFVRHDAVSGIIEISQRKIPSNLDSIVAYFAINYINRFLSKQQIMPHDIWLLKYFPMACFFVASKMMGIENPIANLHMELASQFREHAVKVVAEVVVAVLDSRTRPITPFCFVAYFLAIFPC